MPINLKMQPWLMFLDIIWKYSLRAQKCYKLRPSNQRTISNINWWYTQKLQNNIWRWPSTGIIRIRQYPRHHRCYKTNMAYYHQCQASLSAYIMGNITRIHQVCAYTPWSYINHRIHEWISSRSNHNCSIIYICTTIHHIRGISPPLMFCWANAKCK